MGRQAIIHTIIVGKMEIVLPAMYMMKRFMGICLRGPKAMSQQRFSTRIRSVSCTLVSGTCLSK
uniref:Solute carrier family 12 (Potassium/chloride transporters), member 6 n=1 Tax=Pan troglodytes TaxID=9598 RepID=K7D7J4_PANTR